MKACLNSSVTERVSGELFTFPKNSRGKNITSVYNLIELEYRVKYSYCSFRENGTRKRENGK